LQDVAVLAAGPPVQLRLVFDPWTTYASGPGSTCGVAISLDTSLVASVDAVRLLQHGTTTPVTGAGTGWIANATLAAAVPNPPPAGEAWFAFTNTTGVAVPAGVDADFEFDMTLQLGVMPGDVLEFLGRGTGGGNAVFSDETDGSGMPLLTHDGFTDIRDIAGPDIRRTCQRTVLKESSKFLKTKVKALQKCEEGKVKAQHSDPCPNPGGAIGTPGRKAADKIAKASVKLDTKIGKLCGGADGMCGGNTKNEIGGPFVGFLGACPNFENGSCNGAIDGLECTGVADCLECIDGAAADQEIALLYGALVPSDPVTQVALNKCQVTLGKASSKFLLAKEKNLKKCWDKRFKGQHSDDCPDATAPSGSPAEKAAVAIAKAESKKIAAICKKCGGPGGACQTTIGPVPGDGIADDFTPAQIGFAASCPAVTVPPGPSTPAIPCSAAITTLEDVIVCVDCVSEFKADCVERAQVPEFGPVPTECNL
jgi:hypothetical protein